MKKSKFCILFVLFVIAANIAAVDAQIVLKGKVTTREEEPVAFAAVSLRGMRDTTRLVETAVTDMQGNYAFGKHREGKYLLTIQSLGFRTLNDTVHIRRSSLGNTYEMRKDYLLEEEVTAIDDVVVVGTNVTHYLDRTVYRVTNADRRTAVTGLDLTNKVPQVTLDRINETVSSSDGAVTILVNGIAASAQELKTISPEEVGQIEYYDLPPIRYGGGNAVLNIVTKEVRDGFYGGIDLKVVGYFKSARLARHEGFARILYREAGAALFGAGDDERGRTGVRKDENRGLRLAFETERSEIVLHAVEREFGRRLLFLFRAGCVHGGRHRRSCVHAAGCAEHQCRNCGREDCVHLRLLF